MSLFGIHRDPNYFPNPDGYDPHRFDADNMNYDQAAYMPFGEGPRHCIGGDDAAGVFWNIIAKNVLLFFH